MDVQIRPLRAEDTSGVTKIEREAFPTLWPPTPFKRELENRIAQYLVAWEPTPADGTDGVHGADGQQCEPRPKTLVPRLLSALPLLNALPWYRGAGHDSRAIPNGALVGFVGLWFMAGEAHITAIAVSEALRGRGIGELLLIASIELAMDRKATEVSLEARVSNHVAQSLYRKYGFEQMGIRKGYYTDDREDAVIMTTEPINTPEYQARFEGLREAYVRRHSEIKISLS